MPATLKIDRWVQEGFVEIVSGAGAQSEIARLTAEIQARANANNLRGGEGFAMVTKVAKAYGKTRAIGLVHTTDHKSMVAESEDKALSRAVF